MGVNGAEDLDRIAHISGDDRQRYRRSDVQRSVRVAAEVVGACALQARIAKLACCRLEGWLVGTVSPVFESSSTHWLSVVTADQRISRAEGTAIDPVAKVLLQRGP